MTGYAKRDHLGQTAILTYAYDLIVLFLSFLRHFTALQWLVWFLRYAFTKCGITKSVFSRKQRLNIKPQYSLFTEYPVSLLMIFCVNVGFSLTTHCFTGLFGRPPAEVSAIILNWRKLFVWSCDDLKDKKARCMPVRHLLMVVSIIIVDFGVSTCYRWSKLLVVLSSWASWFQFAKF